jgi:GntR family transcriptional regulator, transcriptional repressor for pyruvate dehydrogenase complex
VLTVLLAEIIEHWSPGSLLPRESDLADRYGVSRGVTREVLRGLEERGIITVRHGHGAIVNPPDRYDVLDAEVLQAVLQGPDRLDVLREVLECRRLLEVQVVALAASRATPAQLEEISAALEDMRAAAAVPIADGGFDPYLEADLRFHAALARAAGNRALFRLTEPLQRAFLAAHQPLARPAARVERSVPEHEHVFRAVVAKDPQSASLAMTQLLRTVEGYLQDLARDSITH